MAISHLLQVIWHVTNSSVAVSASHFAGLSGESAPLSGGQLRKLICHLDSLNEAVAAFQPFTMTDGADLVQINHIKPPPACHVDLLYFVHSCVGGRLVSVLASQTESHSPI